MYCIVIFCPRITANVYQQQFTSSQCDATVDAPKFMSACDSVTDTDSNQYVCNGTYVLKVVYASSDCSGPTTYITPFNPVGTCVTIQSSSNTYKYTCEGLPPSGSPTAPPSPGSPSAPPSSGSPSAPPSPASGLSIGFVILVAIGLLVACL